MPRAIKVLYDFLDTQGALYGIEDPEVLHTWKNNRYILATIVCHRYSIHSECLQCASEVLGESAEEP